MRVSVRVHPPSRGESLEWCLRRVYRDGLAKTSTVVLDEWVDAESRAQDALDEPGVLEVRVLGRPAVEYRSTREHVDGWRVDAVYSLEDDLDDIEGGAR